MNLTKQVHRAKQCSTHFVLAINDTLNVLTGKWKLPIIASLNFGPRRFKNLEEDLPKITPRMLSKELKELELNGIVIRTVYSTTPVTIEYELSHSGKSLNKVLDTMLEWGLQHRKISIPRT
ncbi:MAG TPA: helix-turn-helix domain-containing protein [Niabella sp.]